MPSESNGGTRFPRGQPLDAAAAELSPGHHLMRERARLLAQDAAVPGAAENLTWFIVFRLAAEEYAIEASLVDEVALLKDLTPLPGTPAWVMGIMSLRGRILVVMDVKHFLGLPARALSDLNKVILLNSDRLDLGLLADEIVGMRAVSGLAIQAALPMPGAIAADYVRGVTAERLIVLDVARLLEDKRIIVHDEVDQG